MSYKNPNSARPSTGRRILLLALLVSATLYVPTSAHSTDSSSRVADQQQHHHHHHPLQIRHGEYFGPAMNQDDNVGDLQRFQRLSLRQDFGDFEDAEADFEEYPEEFEEDENEPPVQAAPVPAPAKKMPPPIAAKPANLRSRPIKAVVNPPAATPTSHTMMTPPAATPTTAAAAATITTTLVDNNGAARPADVDNGRQATEASSIPDESESDSAASPFTADAFAKLLPAGATSFAGRTNPHQPSQFWGNHRGPYQTNRWWGNLVFDKGDQPVAPYPYTIRPLDNGITMSSPKTFGTSGFIAQPLDGNWVMTTAEGFNSRKLVSDDDLTATYEWSGYGGNSLRSTFVKGSPYLTYVIKNSTLKLSTLQAILSLDQTNPSRAIATLNNGQTWAIYHDQPLQFTKTLANNTAALEASGPYTGVLRMAVVPAPVDQNLAILDQSSTTYVTGATTQMLFPNDKQFDLVYQFQTAGGPASDLLMLALDHHQNLLVDTERREINGYSCIKGSMFGVLGSQWTLRHTLNQVQFLAANPIRPQDLKPLQDQLVKDVAEFKTVNPGDPYFFGKGLARIARLALIAEHAGRSDLIPQVVNTLKTQISPWFKGTNSDPLRYDTTWKGLCSEAGLNDEHADFGNGVYNDHHFHYGYFVYAAAVIAKYDPTWLNQNQVAVMTLLRDYANPNHNDPYFPFLRQMDLFDGHSWASGIFPFADGRNQESTSESVNAYYAMYLWGLASGNRNLSLVGNALVTMELLSSRNYWHMTTVHSVYPVPFANNKVVGILWSTKVDHATWFGGNLEFIHGIQALPFTPITSSLLDREWLQESYPLLDKAIANNSPPMADGWREIALMMGAPLNKDKALAQVRGITNHDDGNSGSNTLYWISTC
ncbi:hypothetical protein H4R33_000303 [Dimargaris cristalligena]|nr:hypothetical protein H4R33_000303 [Dimargaris cristalligena]